MNLKVLHFNPDVIEEVEFYAIIEMIWIFLLVGHEGIAQEGSNYQERNDEFLSEIMHRVEIVENNDTDNYCFIGRALEFS